MFSNNPSQSNVFLVDAGNNPFFLALLAVEPDPDNAQGHILRASGEFLQPSTWLERTLAFLNLHAARHRELDDLGLPRAKPRPQPVHLRPCCTTAASTTSAS